MKNILVSGGAGFIGINFIKYLLKNNDDIRVINFDKLTYAANKDDLKEFDDKKIYGEDRYHFVQGDICDREALEKVYKNFPINQVVHFAAESHVDNSIHNPAAFVTTNVLGTFQMLDVARKAWGNHSTNRFHHVSTDEVYGSLGDTGTFFETTAYAPNSPYSASKAGSDHLARSYFKTYGMNVTISNCSNNYGPYQHGEKLIPTIIRNAIQGKPIPIYGQGLNIRDWLFVEDHCNAIDLIVKEGVAGETYNVGGDNEVRNIDMALKICEVLNKILPKSEKYEKQITYVSDRPGHDWRYAVDIQKINKNLGWKPQTSFDKALLKTVEWFAKKYKK